MANDMLKEFTKSKDARNAELYGRKSSTQPDSSEKEQKAADTTVPPKGTLTNSPQTQLSETEKADETSTPYVHSAMRGRPVSSSKTARISLAMDPELKERFRVYCASHHKVLSDIIDMLLREYLDNQANNPSN